MEGDINVSQEIAKKLRKAVLNAQAAQSELDTNQESIDRSNNAIAAIDQQISALTSPLTAFYSKLEESNKGLTESIDKIQKLTATIESQRRAYGDNRKLYLQNTKKERKELREVNNLKAKFEKGYKEATKSINTYNKSISVQLSELNKTKDVEIKKTQQLYEQRSALKDIYKKNEQIQKQHREDLELVKASDRLIQNSTRNDLSRIIYEKGKQWAYDPETGRISRGKMAGGVAAAGSAEIATNLFTSSIDAEKAGVTGGWSAHTRAIGAKYGEAFSTGSKVLGGIIGAFAGSPQIGAALGGIVGDVLKKKIELFTEAHIQGTKFGMQDRSTRMAASRLDSKFDPNRSDTPIMITGMDSSSSRAMMESASDFGISTSAGEDSTFMQFAALNRAWGDVSGPLRELIGAYNDQAVAVKELDKAYGYGRKTAKEFGMGITQAAMQFATAGKIARFAGVDASVAEGLMERMSNSKTGANLRLMGYDPSNLGAYVGDLIAAPKDMSLAMQTYFASDGGRKNIDPALAGFMAQYGDPKAFKYDSKSGVASFGANKTSDFLMSMKKEQMRLVSYFGGGPKGFYHAKQVMEALGQSKKQFDLLATTDIGAINSKFVSDYEKVSDNPKQYLSNIYDMAALEEGHMRKMVSIVQKEWGYKTAIEAIRDSVLEMSMTDEEKRARDEEKRARENRERKKEELALAKKNLLYAQESLKSIEDNMASAYAIKGPIQAEVTRRRAEGHIEDMKKYIAKLEGKTLPPTIIAPHMEKYSKPSFAMQVGAIGNAYGIGVPQGFTTSATGYNLPGQAVINQRGASLVEMTISLPYATLQGIVSNAQKGSITTKK